MGKASRRLTMLQMATALQKAVAMYCLMVDHAKGETDLTEDQLAAVVEGVCGEAVAALEAARRTGLIAQLPQAGSTARAHRDPLVVATGTIH